MEKVVVTTKRMSQAIFSLTKAGCKAVEISVVENAVSLIGICENEDRVVLHVWSKEAEEVEAEVGKGERQLTEEELELLDAGKCPLCEEHGPLWRTASSGLAVNISCDANHSFWVPVKPLVPEYLGMATEEKAQAEEAASQDAIGAAEQAVETAAEEALKEIKEKEETGEAENTE